MNYCEDASSVCYTFLKIIQDTVETFRKRVNPFLHLSFLEF